jgi:phosphoribosylformylglycinamidine synthase
MIEKGTLPQIDLNLEKQVQAACLALVDAELLRSAHDCSDGGLAVAIAESCFSSLGREAIGASIEIASNNLSHEAVLFGESPSRIVITFDPEHLDRLKQIVGDCPFTVIGTVGDDVLKINIDGDETISAPVSDLESIWESSLKTKLSH